MLRRSWMLLGLTGLALALAACSSGSTSANGPMEDSSGTVTTVRITALDSLKFDPAQVTVKAGEPITFVVTNTGATMHEFVLGDEAVQMSHEEQMGSGASMSPGMDMDMRALILAAGATEEATVTFDQPGTVLYGCHQPDHYKGGMVGTITVT
jgi:uncharacterized cupredoxin-like copper-binding protein